MGRWTREELQVAHDRFVEVANECARSGDWIPWSEMFCEDATYYEHYFGRMEGRAAIASWISSTMAQWPNSEMTSFPHDWCVCDEERGWWICQIENRFADPGDGGVYQAANLTVLHYAGDMTFSYEEDAYNPANFGPAVTDWLAAAEAAGYQGRSRPSGG
jgi:hypothetical protein